MSNELFQCRICFEEEENPSLLISPCRCDGTSKYVHIDCLQTWLRTTESDTAKKKCMECRTAYKYTANALEESESMYNDDIKDIWKTYGRNMLLICPYSLVFNCIDNYILYQSPIISFIYQPQKQVFHYLTIDEFYSMIFYFSNTTFIFNIRFMMIYLYRIYRSIHRKNIYLKSMSYNILCPIIGIMFYFIINKIIISYDDASNLMSYNLLYIVISQVLYYMMLKQHIDTIQNMNSNIEINILSYVDEIEIDIETKSLELMVS